MRRRRATIARGRTVAIRWHRRADCAPVLTTRLDPYAPRRGPYITAEQVLRALRGAKGGD